jgi:hypothetical protein
MATELCDDPKAYAAIPDRFFDCLLQRRHDFPVARQTRKFVRWDYGGRDTLDMIEWYGTCERCGTTRKMWRERSTREFLGGSYDYPDGYEAPPGTKWDPDLLWAEFYSRHPVKGRAEVVKRERR